MSMVTTAASRRLLTDLLSKCKAGKRCMQATEALVRLTRHLMSADMQG